MLGVLCILYLLALLSGATLADSAFETLRIIENFTHGYALSINPDERVFSFSNPLWVLLNIPTVWLSQPYSYIGLNITGIACYIVAMFFLCATKTIQLKEQITLMVLMTFLGLPFGEMFFSGQEVMLSCALLSVFCWILLRQRASYRWLGFIASLLILNQWQAALIVAPVLCYLLVAHWRKISFFAACIAISPLFFWGVFSLVYYGFFLPNSYYAFENNPSLALRPGNISDIISHLFSTNFYISGLLVCSVWVLLHQLVKTISMTRSLADTEKWQVILLLLVLGTLCFLLFSLPDEDTVLDYRQLLPVFWISLLIMYHYFSSWILPFVKKYLLMILINGYGLLAVSMYVYDKNSPQDHSFIEKDSSRVEGFSFYALWPDSWLLVSPWVKEENVLHAPFSVEIVEKVGQREYMLGPQTLFIQSNAANDILLARLNPNSLAYGYQSPKTHPMPTSYIKARAYQDFRLLTPSRLADYYAPLRTIASSDELFAPERWRAILGMQLWWYDGLRADYQIDYENLSDPFYDGRYDPTKAEGL